MTEVNDYDDSTDEAIEEDADIPDSDTEQDPIVFLSNNEDDKLEFESDYESTDAEDSENDKSDSYEETEQDLQTKLRDKNKSIVKKSLVHKGKTAKKKITSTNKSGSNKDQRDCQEIQTHKGSMCNKRETKNISDRVYQEKDEYEYDSSDEEDIRNTIGKVPIKWYDEYKHIGYNWEGQKILKPEKGDELDNFLKRMEDPDFWRTIKDSQTGQDVVLNEEDIDLIVRIQKQKVPDVQFDEYAVSCIYVNSAWIYVMYI